LREFFDNARGYAASERIPADEIQEGLFHPIMDDLAARGFHGMSHRGGLRTKTPEHKVTIYFNPDETIRLRKMSEGELAGLRQPEAKVPVPPPASSKDPLDKIPMARDDGTPTLVSARQAAKAGERETELSALIRECK
jgi:hypothetical protein